MHRSIVLKHLENSIKGEEKTAIAYAYFKHDFQEQQTPAAIISSFIKQICLDSRIPEFLIDFYRKFDNNLENPSIDDYISQYQWLIKAFDKVFLVIDALDECKESYREDILSFFSDILQAHACIKIFVTSRKEEDIENAFSSQQTPVIPIEAREVRKDIEVFVRGRVQEFVQTKKLYISTAELKEEVISTLINGAEGMFV